MSKPILIETKTAEELEDIYDRLKSLGLKKEDYEAYLPYPSHSLLEKIGQDIAPLPSGVVSAVGSFFGFFLGMALQTYPNVYGYPLRVGGHPHFSWYDFLVISIELAILFGALFLLAHLIYHLYQRGKMESAILEECPSQIFALRIKSVRASFEEELEKIKKERT